MNDEELVLTLLNTTPTLDGARTDRLFADPVEAAVTCRAWGGIGTHAQVDALARARDLVQRAVVERSIDASLDEILATARRRPCLTPTGLTWRLEAPARSAPAMRFLIAWSDLQLRRPGRLRSCANEECSLFLLDRSTGNRGRWCAMATCGNRLKARRHQKRAREQSD